MNNEDDRRNLNPYENPRDSRDQSRNPNNYNNLNNNDNYYEQQQPQEPSAYNQGQSDPYAFEEEYEQENFDYDQNRMAYEQNDQETRNPAGQDFREPVYNADEYQDDSREYTNNAGAYNQYSAQKQVIQQKPSKFLIFLNELLIWVKNFFSARPSSAVESAEYSQKPFPWAIFLGIFAIAGALRGLFNAIGAGRNAGYIVGRLFGFILLAALIYLINVLIMFIAKKLGGTLNKWYQAFNAAAALSFPIFIAWVILIVTGSFFNPAMIVINDWIKLIAYLFTDIILVQVLNKELQNRKAKDWWIFGLVLLQVVLVTVLGNTLYIAPEELEVLKYLF